MELFWFTVLTLMLAMYVVLDGFDFGTGIVYLFAARSEPERRAALAAIGPVWNGNEVWLISAGGVLFMAFPKAYAAGFSGFYLALFIVLWLFMFRGLAIELRAYLAHPLWRVLLDLIFSGASLLLALVFGAALGNLIRGVPLNADGYFFTPLWTTFAPGSEPGILDWYTVLMGLTSLVILTVHGANYLVMKTEGNLAQRARWLAEQGSWMVVVLSVVSLLAIPVVQPGFRCNFDANPLGYVLPFAGVCALAGMIWFQRARWEGAAFAASSLMILAFLGSAAWGVFPNILIATMNPDYSLTIYNASAMPYGLQVAMVWFPVGFSLVIAYTVFVHRLFWGKVDLRTVEESH